MEDLDKAKIEAAGTEEVKEETKEEEPQEFEVEEEPQPWEKLKADEESNLIDEYEKQSKLDNETRDNINNIIRQETDQKRIDFAQEWFEEHKDEIREKGYDTESREDGYAVKVAKELGGFEELKEKEEYSETNETIDNLYVLRADLQKDAVPLESQFLILNLLNKKTERAEQELKAAEKKGDATKSVVKQEELNELFKVQKELSEKISNRDLTQEADEKTDPLEEKQEYLDKNLDGYTDKRMEEISETDVKNEIVYARELGYTTAKKGLILRKIEVKDSEGNVLTKLKQKDLENFLSAELDKKLGKELEEEWEMKNEERQNTMKELIGQEIKALSGSPEKAEQGIESIYDRVKKRLKAEFIEKDLKKSKKTKEQLQEIKKEFKGKGKDPAEFIDKLINREDSLEDLEGNLDRDKKKISSFLEDWGVLMEDGKLEEFEEMMEKKGKSYSEAAKGQKGLFEWILELIFFDDSESKKSK